jgi:cysteinyl-tRNA synthetase
MAREYLGDSFDIHGGGTDLIFPHHENEIAQSEAATGRTFARYWLHNGMLNLSGEKMAKSTGHVVTLAGALDAWDPMAVRLFYLRTHYRKPLDYTESALADAEASLSRLRAFRRRIIGPVEDPPRADILDQFKAAMDDDLDISRALAVLFDTVREGNSGLDAGADVSALAAAFDEMMTVFGLTVTESPEADEGSVAALAESLGINGGDMDDLLALRAKARADKDWATADAIRDGLAELDITIEDTADGVRWHRN